MNNPVLISILLGVLTFFGVIIVGLIVVWVIANFFWYLFGAFVLYCCWESYKDKKDKSNA